MITNMKCRDCLGRGLTRPRNAVTLLMGTALCAKCLTHRDEASAKRASLDKQLRWRLPIGEEITP